MNESRPRLLFLNLPVRDLAASRRFFARLGFRFHPRYSDDLAACMIVSRSARVVLLTQPFFAAFAARPACDPRACAEAGLALVCRSRAEVQALFAEALRAGATPVGEPLDQGLTYTSSFRDLDGHPWQLRWTDPDPVLA